MFQKMFPALLLILAANSTLSGCESMPSSSLSFSNIEVDRETSPDIPDAIKVNNSRAGQKAEERIQNGGKTTFNNKGPINKSGATHFGKAYNPHTGEIYKEQKPQKVDFSEQLHVPF